MIYLERPFFKILILDEEFDVRGKNRKEACSINKMSKEEYDVILSVTFINIQLISTG